MPQIIITVTDEEVKAIEGIVVDATTWIINAWVTKNRFVDMGRRRVALIRRLHIQRQQPPHLRKR